MAYATSLVGCVAHERYCYSEWCCSLYTGSRLQPSRQSCHSLLRGAAFKQTLPGGMQAVNSMWQHVATRQQTAGSMQYPADKQQVATRQQAAKQAITSRQAASSNKAANSWQQARKQCSAQHVVLLQHAAVGRRDWCRSHMQASYAMRVGLTWC